jgi:hypothetical protein
MHFLQGRLHADVRYAVGVGAQHWHDGKRVNELGKTVRSRSLELAERVGHMPVECNAALRMNSGVGGLGKCHRRHHHACTGHCAQFEEIASTFFHFDNRS